MTNSVDPDQTASIGAVCSGSMLFASILNSSVMLGNYLQQTKFSDAFFLGAPIGVHAVCFYTQFVSNAMQLFAADDFSRQHFQVHFFFLAL